MLFLPYFYALDFYINEFTKVFFPRTLLMLQYKTLGLKWRPLSLNSFFATEWSLIYIPTLSKGEVSCSRSLTEHAISDAIRLGGYFLRAFRPLTRLWSCRRGISKATIVFRTESLQGSVKAESNSEQMDNTPSAAPNSDSRSEFGGIIADIVTARWKRLFRTCHFVLGRIGMESDLLRHFSRVGYRTSDAK